MTTTTRTATTPIPQETSTMSDINTEVLASTNRGSAVASYHLQSAPRKCTAQLLCFNLLAPMPKCSGLTATHQQVALQRSLFVRLISYS